MIGTICCFAIFAFVCTIVEAQVIIPQSLKKFSPPPSKPSTVDDIKLPAYLGKWYQMYASLIPNQTFERNGYCVTAEYYPSNNPSVAFGVKNTLR